MSAQLNRLNVRRTLYRALQFVEQILPIASHEVDWALEELLQENQLVLLKRLSPADRRHHLQVHSRLLSLGYRSQDLLHAALLHDVGKASERARVRTLHRVIKVVLARYAPKALRDQSQTDGNWLQRGLFLAVEHPRLGAELARAAGASERTCWLIEHHHDGTILEDAELDALRSADERG